MLKKLKIILPVIFWGIFVVVILKVDYPENITSANLLQLSYFFIPFFLALTFTFNLLLSFSFSIFITLGIIILLILKSLDGLSFISGILTISAILLLLSYFKKSKKLTGLTSRFKIPKLRSLRRRKHV